jgi:hypothetical protein
MYIFLPQIYFGTSQYKLKKGIFFVIEFFVLKSTILCKKFERICFNMTMVEVQKWTPLENTIQCDKIFGPLVVCFHPRERREKKF